MPAVATLAVSVRAQTAQFNREMRASSQRLRRFTRDAEQSTGRLRKMGGALGLGRFLNPYTAAIGGLALVGAGLKRTLTAAEQFNRAMNQSLAIMGDVADVMRRDMSAAAIEVARVTQFSATDAARSYFFLASAGLSTKQSLEALPVVAKFAQAGMFDLARATDLVTDAQSALGLSVASASQNMLNMTRVADVLVKANTLANASVEQFSQSLTTKAGAAIKVLGKDLEEGVAVLAAFADQGVKAGDAGTALNIILRDLSTKAIKNAAAFEQHRIAVFDSEGEMRNLAVVIGDIERALDGMSDAEAKATLLQLGFADKSVIFLQTLLGLSGRIADYESALRDAAGTMDEVASKQLTTLQKGMASLGASATAMANNFSFVNVALGKGASGLAAYMRVGQRAVDFLKEGFFPPVVELEKQAAAMKDVATATEEAAASGIKLAQGPTIPQKTKDAWQIIADLQAQLGEMDLGPATAAVQQLRELGVSKGFVNLAKAIGDDLDKAMERAFDVDRVEGMADALDRQLALIENTRKEFDLLEAARFGATKAQLAEIAAIHDAITAAEERRDAEREITREIERRNRLVDRGGTMALQISPSRTALGGVSSSREQLVRDPQNRMIITELQRIEGNTREGMARAN